MRSFAAKMRAHTQRYGGVSKHLKSVPWLINLERFYCKCNIHVKNTLKHTDLLMLLQLNPLEHHILSYTTFNKRAMSDMRGVAHKPL